MFRRTPEVNASLTRHPDFEYLGGDSIYMDSACQSLRPQPVITALTDYFTQYNACGGRAKYAWGTRVDREVAETRVAVLRLLGLSARSHAVSFTLNTTYGLNLLLQQLPRGVFDRIVTSHIEHNSVFLSTMTAATRLGVERLVLERAPDGSLVYTAAQVERAVVVVNVTSNVDGIHLGNLAQLVEDTHKHGGIVILDAAQTMAHSAALLSGIKADAICFSGHKMYGASLGVIVSSLPLLQSLEISFIGGGMVSDVREDSFDLLASEPGALLEPGLQAWGEIIALRQAISWTNSVRFGGQRPAERIATLSHQLFDALSDIPQLRIISPAPSPVVTVLAPGQDSHRLAVFLSHAGIMARSGYFCAHHYLKEQRHLPPLLRFSLGLHTTDDDITTTHQSLGRLLKGLA